VMGLSNSDGPFYTYGNMGSMTAAAFGMSEPDPNLDAGPNAEFQGDGLLDPRWFFIKDQLQGYTGKQPVHFSMPYLRSIGQIPAAFGTATIAALANVTSGTAMTLAAANATGITINVPIIPFNAGGIANLAL